MIAPLRRRRLFLAATVTIGLLGVVRFACSSGNPIRGRWSAGLDRYDYLEVVDIEGEGKGRMLQGDSQNIRIDIRFRYRLLEGSTLEIDDGEAAPRRLRFDSSDGEYRFEQPTPTGPIEIVCRRRVTFSAAIFPHGHPSTRVFYTSCKQL